MEIGDENQRDDCHDDKEGQALRAGQASCARGPPKEGVKQAAATPVLVIVIVDRAAAPGNSAEGWRGTPVGRAFAAARRNPGGPNVNRDIALVVDVVVAAAAVGVDDGSGSGTADHPDSSATRTDRRHSRGWCVRPIYKKPKTKKKPNKIGEQFFFFFFFLKKKKKKKNKKKTRHHQPRGSRRADEGCRRALHTLCSLATGAAASTAAAAAREPPEPRGPREVLEMPAHVLRQRRRRRPGRRDRPPARRAPVARERGVRRQRAAKFVNAPGVESVCADVCVCF
jgi:hypothetical protein